jgi:hypothetical protein
LEDRFSRFIGLSYGGRGVYRALRTAPKIVQKRIYERASKPFNRRTIAYNSKIPANFFNQYIAKHPVLLYNSQRKSKTVCEIKR